MKDYPPPLKKKFWVITCTTIWVCYYYYGVCFAHLLILQYHDHYQNLITSSLYYSGPLHTISSQSVHNFLSNVVHRQTNRQTNHAQRYQKHNLLCEGGNKRRSLKKRILMINVFCVSGLVVPLLQPASAILVQLTPDPLT